MKMFMVMREYYIVVVALKGFISVSMMVKGGDI